MFKLCEKDSQMQEIFAYCLIEFSGLPIKDEATSTLLTVKGNIIGNNMVLGEFNTTLLFEIEGDD